MSRPVVLESLERRRLFAAQYTLTLLPPPAGATDSHAYAVNSAGQIVGYASVGSRYVPVEWTGGKAVQLPESPAGDRVAVDINDAGTVLYGRYKRTTAGFFKPLAVPGGRLGSAGGMNNAGDVAGDDAASTTPLHATVFKGDGQVITLTAGSSSRAWDINDSGVVVGSAGTAAGSVPFSYSGGTVKFLSVPPVTTQYAEARSVNRNGVVAGFFTTSAGVHHAAMWTNGALKDLGTMTAVAPKIGWALALGIDAAGEVVGYGSSGAFVYKNGAMHDLNTLIAPRAGVTLQQAWGTNDKGQIVGSADTPTGWQAFVLTPLAGGSIRGTTYNDANSNGVRDTGEAALPNWKVYLDADRDGFLDAGERTATTDASGNYVFTNVAAGSWRVREVLPAGWRRTAPAWGYPELKLAAGQAVTSYNFGNTQKVLITGSVFNDLNRDGKRESGEPALSGWRVFIDKDNDGVLDAGENNVLTDAAGNWTFRQLPAGTYTVRATAPAGWARSAPAAGYFKVSLSSGGSSTGKVFGVRKL